VYVVSFEGRLNINNIEIIIIIIIIIKKKKKKRKYIFFFFFFALATNASLE